jgi:hypothetical protein
VLRPTHRVYAALNTFVVGNDLPGNPNNWSAEQRERFDRTVNDLHTGAANLCTVYDKLPTTRVALPAFTSSTCSPTCSAHGASSANGEASGGPASCATSLPHRGRGQGSACASAPRQGSVSRSLLRRELVRPILCTGDLRCSKAVRSNLKSCSFRFDDLVVRANPCSETLSARNRLVSMKRHAHFRYHSSLFLSTCGPALAEEI